MPIHVSWGNAEKTYTCFTYTGNWTWAEYYQSIEHGYALTKDLPHTVNILLDLSDARLFPTGLLTNIQSSMEHPPRHFTVAAIVSTSPYVMTVANMIDRVYGRQGTQFKIFKTRAEAEAYLAEYDRTSNALPKPASVPATSLPPPSV